MFRRRKVVEAASQPPSARTPQRQLLMLTRDDAGRLVLVGKAPTGDLEVWTASITPAIAPVQVKA